MEIPAHLLDQVIHAARLDWPHEVCGVLAGPLDGPGPTERWALENVAEHRRHRYAFDEDDQLAAWRAIENEGHRVFVIYHSHTDGTCELSPEDLRHALDPDIAHLVIGLPRADGPPRWALWQANHGMAIELPLTVTP